MGEYAKHNGQEIKIGTCESMYYLRLSQTQKVERMSGNVDPWKDREELWFRIPWTDEHDVPPGQYRESSDRGFPIMLPEDIIDDHGITQCTNNRGLLLNVPCTPATRKPADGGHLYGTEIHAFRNGGGGGYKIKRLSVRAGQPALLLDCIDCERSWSVRGEGAVNLLPQLPKALQAAILLEWEFGGVVVLATATT